MILVAFAQRLARRVLAGARRPLAQAADGLREAARELRDPYRPELHYMRGPGPRWHERHGAPRAA